MVEIVPMMTDSTRKLFNKMISQGERVVFFLALAVFLGAPSSHADLDIVECLNRCWKIHRGVNPGYRICVEGCRMNENRVPQTFWFESLTPNHPKWCETYEDDCTRPEQEPLF